MIKLNSAYDNDNIFAKILRGELPNITVLETANVLAFMDIMPQREGHTLVVPKCPAVCLLDLPADYFEPLLNATQRVAAAVQKAVNAQGITIMQLNGSAAGQTVPHLHFHVIPGSILGLAPHSDESESPKAVNQEALIDVANRIKMYL